MKPQARKVLRHLKAAGAAGLHSRDLRRDFIADPPTRVCELRALGFNITREKEGNGTRYRLHGLSEGVGTDAGTSTSPGPSGTVDPLAELDQTPAEVGVDTGSQSAHANGVGVDPSGMEVPPVRSISPPRSDGGGQVHTAAPVRYPAQSMKAWSTPPDSREGWHRVRDLDGSWWWELRPEKPAQTELVA